MAFNARLVSVKVSNEADDNAKGLPDGSFDRTKANALGYLYHALIDLRQHLE